MTYRKNDRGGLSSSLIPTEKHPQKFENVEDALLCCPRNQTIGDNLIRTWAKINNDKYNKIVCAISGGSDSDIILDIVWKCDINNKIEYVWFDTGLEYQATKDHLKYLENKYDITIRAYRAIKPIPISCKEFGQPFMSKYVSDMMERLQRHKFQWEDEPLEKLLKKYCSWNEEKQDWVGCKIALQWWCNASKSIKFCIDYNKYLKEFIINNPPQFSISNRCCKYAKKDLMRKLILEEKYDLVITGIRRSEGGIRSSAYKSCFDESDKYDNYRPIFWYTNQDKNDYENYNDVNHSNCYSEYGLNRTGCAGCPFGKNFLDELKIMSEYEPKLYLAAKNVFRDSYEYTEKYRNFVEGKKRI